MKFICLPLIVYVFFKAADLKEFLLLFEVCACEMIT